MAILQSLSMYGIWLFFSELCSAKKGRTAQWNKNEFQNYLGVICVYIQRQYQWHIDADCEMYVLETQTL